MAALLSLLWHISSQSWFLDRNHSNESCSLRFSHNHSRFVHTAAGLSADANKGRLVSVAAGAQYARPVKPGQFSACSLNAPVRGLETDWDPSSCLPSWDTQAASVFCVWLFSFPSKDHIFGCCHQSRAPDDPGCIWRGLERQQNGTA